MNRSRMSDRPFHTITLLVLIVKPCININSIASVKANQGNFAVCHPTSLCLRQACKGIYLSAGVMLLQADRGARNMSGLFRLHVASLLRHRLKITQEVRPTRYQVAGIGMHDMYTCTRYNKTVPGTSYHMIYTYICLLFRCACAGSVTKTYQKHILYTNNTINIFLKPVTRLSSYQAKVEGTFAIKNTPFFLQNFPAPPRGLNPFISAKVIPRCFQDICPQKGRRSSIIKLLLRSNNSLR